MLDNRLQGVRRVADADEADAVGELDVHRLMTGRVPRRGDQPQAGSEVELVVVVPIGGVQLGKVTGKHARWSFLDARGPRPARRARTY